MSEDILDTVEGGVLTITLNRPDEGNGLNDAGIAQLAALLQGAAARARLVVLKGAGKDFCVGRIAPRGAAAPKLEALQVRKGRDVVFNCYSAFRDSPIPIIAAVNGRALGFGFAIATCADITLAADNAVFQMPEFGENIMPTIAMSALLGKVSGKRLMHIAYSTAELSAERAEKIGLISDVVACSGARFGSGKALRNDSESAAAGGSRDQGVCACCAFDGYSRSDRLRAEPPRCHQFFKRDAT